MHMTDPDTPMEEIVRAFNWCIDKGMALYWATSEWPPYLIMEAHAVAEKLQLIAPITEVYIYMDGWRKVVAWILIPPGQFM